MPRFSDKADIMAIGDSLYQGVRSLTISADLAAHSVPVMVAGAMGKPFVPAMPHRPVLFDLEAMIRGGGIFHLLVTIRDAALRNVEAWLGEPNWSDHEAFDNLALGGAEISDLSDNTFDVYFPKVEAAVAELKQRRGGVRELATTIGKLWCALNVCFVLNPSRKEHTPQSAASPIEQVAARRPDLLLVNIGSNEGLFRAGFAGQYDGDAIKSIDRIPAKMRDLAERLKDALPTHTRVCVNSLVRPRTIPNLMPPQNFEDFPGDANFPIYRPRIGDGNASISAERMSNFDGQIKRVNGEVANLMQEVLGNRLTFVDLFDACDAFDGKHYADRAVTVASANKRLRNYPLDALFGIFNAGGLSGLDNMHPSVPGYALVAGVVLKALGEAGTISIDDAYEADTLLQNLPFTLPVLDFEFALLGSLGVLRDVSIGASS